MIEFLAWPGAVVALGLVFMILFRKPIAGVLQRTKSVSKSGLHTFESPQLPAPADKPDPLEEFLGTYDNPLLREQEANILEDLKRRGLGVAAAAQRALVRSLAGTQILLLFEKIQSVIYASQIDALTYLNSRPMPVEPSELRPFYDSAAQRHPDFYANYSFDSWLGFLQSWLLIQRTGRHMLLSSVGREFLKWRIEDKRAGPFHG